MALLYEPENSLVAGVYKVGFRVKHHSVNPAETRQKTINRLQRFNWLSHGLELLAVEVNTTENEVYGTLTLKVIPSFFPWLAVSVLIPSILGFVGTIAQLWVVREIASPLLAPGPLGLPMLAWIFITAAGVLIPVVLIKRRK